MAETGTYAKQLAATLRFVLRRPYGTTAQDLAEYLDCTRQTAARYLRALDSSGMLESEWRGDSIRTPRGTFEGSEAGRRKAYWIHPMEMGVIYKSNQRFFECLENGIAPSSIRVGA